MHADGSEPPVADSIRTFRRQLEGVVADARSLRDIEAWLRTQPGVAAVVGEDYLIKTNPPRRVITFMVGGQAGSERRRQLVVVEHRGGRYEFWDLRGG